MSVPIALAKQSEPMPPIRSPLLPELIPNVQSFLSASSDIELILSTRNQFRIFGYVEPNPPRFEDGVDERALDFECTTF